GVMLYRKNYNNGVPDYVQVIDLGLGAQVIPLHGGIAEARPAKGVYGGADPRFYSKTLQKYWRETKDLYPNTFCVTNGQFFYMLEYPTRLPFPLRIDSQVITEGYDQRGFPGQKLLLLLWPGKADIVPLDKDTLYNTSAPHAIAGLTEDARKSPTKYVGRTFVGVDDRDGNGQAEVVLIFSTRSARQNDAAEVLRSFGADRVMMFDGGGSAQLTCQGVDYVASERLLPQALGVVAAPARDAPQIKYPSHIPAVPIKDETLENEQIIAQSDEGAAENPQQVETSQPVAELPVQAALYASPESLKLENVIWVPASILPLALIVLLVVDRVRHNTL
ncbi:MAG TPA: phosphodiester glycosidase family protein, partial [Anaerolineales bacterium]|nr:phosphodiester glycosidase family protein [Anaerolineales bacterium]